MEPNEKKKQEQLAIFRNHIGNHYMPTNKISDSDLQLSTREIFNKMQDLCPSIFYEESNIYDLLTEMGFHFHENGDLTFHWLLKQK